MENKDAVIINCKNGEVIFEQGVYEPWMFDIRWGKVGIYLNYGTKEEKLLTTLEGGQFFGEMGIIECCPRSAAAVSLDDATQLQKIDAETFTSYFKDKPEKMLLIMQHMSHRIRELTKDYMEACKALADTVEGEQNKEKKTSLLEKLEKFIDDYAAMSSAIDSNALYNPYDPFNNFFI